MAKPETLDDFVAHVAKQRFHTLQFRHVPAMQEDYVCNDEAYPGVIFCGTKVWESLRDHVPFSRESELHVPTNMWPWLHRTPTDCDFVRQRGTDGNEYAVRQWWPSPIGSPEELRNLGRQVKQMYAEAVMEAEAICKQLDEASRKKHSRD